MVLRLNSCVVVTVDTDRDVRRRVVRCRCCHNLLTGAHLLLLLLLRLIHADPFISCGSTALVRGPLAVALVYRVQLGLLLVKPAIVDRSLLASLGRLLSIYFTFSILVIEVR